MANTGRSKARLQPIDTTFDAASALRQPAPANESLGDDRADRAMRALLRRERASAYWFAASKWGMSGLVIGMLLGAGLMYFASIAALPIAQDAVARGAAIAGAVDSITNAPRPAPAGEPFTP
jgi:hypothetical protein